MLTKHTPRAEIRLAFENSLASMLKSNDSHMVKVFLRDIREAVNNPRFMRHEAWRHVYDTIFLLAEVLREPKDI